MNIVVLVKQVPDSGSPRSLVDGDKTVDRESADLVINEMDEYAIEEALRLKESGDGEVTILTVGPDSAKDTIRKALSMGADKAVHVTDEAIAGSCAVDTSKVIAAALRRLEFDLVLCGAESTDGRVSVMPAMLSERLGVTQLTGARKVTVDGSSVTIERQVDGGYQIVTGSTPAIISVWDTINEPRYPSFKGIMQAKNKPVETLSLSDLGVEAGEVGLDHATSKVLDFAARPPRSGGESVKDEGDGGVKLVDYLVAQKLV